MPKDPENEAQELQEPLFEPDETRSDPYDEDNDYEAQTGEGASPPVATVHPKTPQQIEDAFLKRKDRTLHQKLDFLLPQIETMIEQKRVLDLTPAYQRRFRWDRKKQSLLIESLLLNVPMPSVFLYETELAEYEVMDGRQRLATIYDFLKGGFKLQGLAELPYLNGKYYKDLPGKLQATLRRASLPVTIILTESHTDEATAVKLRQLVFERLNTGGQSLNPQEVRNCIYSGPFNDMLVRTARSTLFTSAWGIPQAEPDEQTQPSKKLKRNRLFATMQDCAIVLRYFAFADLGAYSSPKKTLDDFMRSNRYMDALEANKLEEDYLESLDLARQIYKDSLFRIYPHLINPNNPNTSGLLSVPLSDAVMSACRAFRANKESLVNNCEAIVSDTLELMKKRDTYEALISSKNTKEEVKKRMNLIAGVFEKHK